LLGCGLDNPNAVDAGYPVAVNHISKNIEDPWPATVQTIFGTHHSIIHTSRENVVGSLNNIHMLWQLGNKPPAPVPRAEIAACW
jgi:hypothetical protein